MMRYAWLIASGLLAQQLDQQPVIKLDVRQVLVPVVVTDKNGHHITGLRASGFQIFEDGIQQDIAAFTSDTAGALTDATAPQTPVTSGAKPVTRAAQQTYVICVDTLHSSAAHSGRFREALERLFENDQGTDAQYSLISLGRQLQVVQTATSNSSAILAKVRSKAFQSTLGGLDATALASEISDLKDRMGLYCKKCPYGGREPARGKCSAEKDQLKQSIDAQVERWAALTATFLAGLKRLVEELAKLPDRRALVLVSDGFNLRPAREFYAVVSAYLPNTSAFKTDFPQDLQPALQETLKTAAEHNVVIYTIHSGGVSSPDFSSGGSMDATARLGSNSAANRGGTVMSGMDRAANSVAFENSSAMEQLAHASGGLYLHDNNDLLKGLRSALADGREYYMLAYVPKIPPADGKFRRITVEVRDKKLKVRAKSGYWAAPPTVR